MYTRNCIGRLGLMLTLVSATPAMATDRTVNKPGGSPHDYSTITAAIADSGDGDVITVYDRPGMNPAYVLWDTGSEGNDRLEIGNLDGVTLQGYDYGPNPSDKVVIDGNRANANEAVGINILTTSDNITVKNFWITNCDQWAIKTNSPGADHTIDDVYFDDNYHIALQISSNNNIVKNCVFNSTLEDTGISGPSGDGCRVVDASGCKISDCVSSNNDNDGFRLADDANTEMTDCDSHSNDRQGLKTIRTAGLKVTRGNYYSNAATGIQLETASSNAKIVDVDIYDNNTGTCNEAGLWIDDTDDVLVEDCRIDGNALGIRVMDANRVIIRFNRVFENKRDGCTVGDQRQGGMMYQNVNTMAVYHNTFYDNCGTFSTAKDDWWGGFGADIDNGTATNSRVSFVNNIVSIVNQHSNDDTHIMQFYGTSEIEDLDYNVYYQPPTTAAFHIRNQTDRSFASYQGVSGIDETNSVESSSNPVSGASHAPQGDAESAAGPLTDAGDSGTEIEVGNAAYFWPGDVVKTNLGTTATVLSVDYANDEVEFNTSMTANHLIYLNRTGNSNVDIGAVQD